MTDFYAIYFFIVLGIILFGIGLWFKYSWIFWLAGLGWGMTGIYCLVEGYSHARSYVIVLGMFCLAFCMACYLAPMFIKKSLEKPPIVKSDREQRYDRMTERKKRATGLMPRQRNWWES